MSQLHIQFYLAYYNFISYDVWSGKKSARWGYAAQPRFACVPGHNFSDNTFDLFKPNAQQQYQKRIYCI